MRGVGRSLALAAVIVLVAAAAARAGETGRAAQGSERGVASASLTKTTIHTDPYRRYFSGHWCNCWRKVNLTPIDEEAQYAGVLPRTDTPMWMKHKVIDMKGFTAQEKFLCRAFSGLVNRRKAQWYCKEENDFWFAGSRSYLKDAIEGRPIRGIWNGGKKGGQQVGQTVNKDRYIEGIKRFVVEMDPPSIDGCIIYDPALLDPETKPKQPRDLLNVIRTMCAIERALPLTPQLYEELIGKVGDPGKLPVVMDTTKREDWNIDKFHGDEKAAAYSLYAWAFNNFWKNDKNPKRQCDHHVLAFLPPMGPPSNPEQDLTDYLVKWRVFCFYSEGGEKLDEKHMEYVLTQTPMNIPVIGQLTAATGPEAEAARARLLRLFSRFGKFFVDFSEAPNLTLHSGERPEERQQYQQKSAPARALDANKSYVAFCLTGANSIGHYMSARANHWDFASRGSVPIGWAVPPLAADVLPNVTKYYYAKATENDCFVADLGGLGMALPTVWGAGSNQPENLLAQYYKRSQEYLGYLDLSTIWAAWLDDKTLGNMTQNIDGLNAVFYGSKGAGRYLERASFMHGTVPVIHTYVDMVANAAALEQLPATLAQSKERFVFVGVDETGFGPQEDVVAEIAKVAGQLGDKYVVVRPDQLASLYADAVKANQVPAEAPKLARSATTGEPQPTLKSVTADGTTREWSKLPAMRAVATRDGTVAAASKQPADAAAEISAVVD